MKPQSILIVDDIPSNIKLLKAILSHEPVEIFTAITGPEAIESVKKNHPSLILLDIMMPNMDGFETCNKIKELPEAANCPIIFVSAQNDINNKILSFKLGAVDYISKPFHKDEVLARVRIHLKLEKTISELHSSEQNYIQLLQACSDGIVAYSFSEGIIFANDSFAQLVHYPLSSIAESQISQYVYAEDIPEFESLLTQALIPPSNNQCHDSSLGTHIFRFLSSDKKTLHTSCRFSSIKINNEPYVLISICDITERINQERQLFQTQKMEAIGSLAAGIAHDFNNILAIINGYAELITFELPENDPAREQANIILTAGRNASALTKGLLAFSRKKYLMPESIDINQEIKLTNSFLARSIPPNIKIELNLSTSPIQVLADPAFIQQAILNLCINARDAMLSGGRICISSQQVFIENLPPVAPPEAKPGHYAMISIEDNGSGIPDQIIDQIFNPFFTTKDQGHGSGLGLSMVERTFRNHHGWITVQSQLNKGTTFSAFLPILSESSLAELNPKAYKHKHHSQLNNILIISENPTYSAIFQHFLQRENYTVFTALSPDEAFSMIQNDPSINTLIFDHITPTITGAQIVEKAKEIKPDIKTIMTAPDGNLLITSNTLLRKPFTNYDLLVALDRLDDL